MLDLASLRSLLGPQVLSEDSMLRTAAIKILAQSAPDAEALQLCLDAEAMPLTIQDAREKAIAIRKIGVSASKLAASSPDFDLALRYLIAMLKVNFKPLWSEAISAIANMAKNRKSADASSIWAILYSELLQATTAASQNPLASTEAVPWAETAADSQQITADSLTSDLRCTSHDRITQAFQTNIVRFSDSSQDGSAGKFSSFAEVSSLDALSMTRTE
jgi:U3 small nucleolar RNA-associated protein 20